MIDFAMIYGFVDYDVWSYKVFFPCHVMMTRFCITLCISKSCVVCYGKLALFTQYAYDRILYTLLKYCILEGKLYIYSFLGGRSVSRGDKVLKECFEHHSEGSCERSSALVSVFRSTL